jgi:hypothetical protein
MGLDSVELLMEWEKYFGIEIPDLVAEKMGTVEEAVNAISDILNITEEGLIMKEECLRRLHASIQKAGLGQQAITVSEYVYRVVPDTEMLVWSTISRELELEIPLPPTRDSKKTIFGFMLLSSGMFYDELLFSQLIDVIYGANYLKLIDPKTISNKYEIYSVIMALTVDKIGIDYYEFQPGKSFTKDLGLS